jgi:hypothetical protein
MSGLAAKRLTNLILTKDPEKMTSGEFTDLQGVISEAIRVVAGQTLAAEAANSHLYSYQTYNHLFEMLAKFRPTASAPVQDHLEGCQNFFKIAFKQFEPKTRAEWLKILLHKDVNALRQKIAETIQAGSRIDNQLAQKEMNELLSTLGAMDRKRVWAGRGIKSVELAAGAITTVVTSSSLLTGLIAGAAVSGLGVAGSEIVEARARARVRNKFRWMYFMPHSQPSSNDPNDSP